MKNNKELIKKLNPYWQKAKKIEEEFYSKIEKLERKMFKELKIKDLELFICDGSIVGVGNYNRTMKLILVHQIKEE